MIQRLTFALIIFTAVVFGSNAIIAQEPDGSQNYHVVYEKVNPADGFNYGLKRFKEKISLFFKFSKEAKADLLSNQVEARLAELSYTVEKRDMANFETATTRYFTSVAAYTAHLREKQVDYDKEKLMTRFDGHIGVIKKLQANFDGTTAEWRFLEDDINYIKAYLQAL